MAARVIVKKPLKNSVKVITGDLLQETFTKVTIAVTEPSGNKAIKSFSKEKYAVTIIRG